MWKFASLRVRCFDYFLAGKVVSEKGRCQQLKNRSESRGTAYKNVLQKDNMGMTRSTDWRMSRRRAVRKRLVADIRHTAGPGFNRHSTNEKKVCVFFHFTVLTPATQPARRAATAQLSKQRATTPFIRISNTYYKFWLSILILTTFQLNFIQ